MSLTVGQLEEKLFDAFPRWDAESWDQPGLAVGDRNTTVEGVAVNLDMTAEAVVAADEAGCNVLVTHHPPFIKSGPTQFTPQADCGSSGPGRMIYEAASRGISVIAMHTNADRAICTREMYASMLSWECVGNFEHLMDKSREVRGTGFGALFNLPKDTTLQDAACLCSRVFGGSPRVWGNPRKSLHKIALLNGSWGEQAVYDICVAHDIDCAVVGETRYHFCADAQPHLAIIDLGHDKSELPIQQVLSNAVMTAGIDPKRIVTLNCSSKNWWTPDVRK